jgi:Cu(I)/Ag(I) efflux system membrane protein CusA/SilA
VTKAAELLQTQDRIIKSFPEVESVFGKAGRAMTATDPAPLEMSETIVNLKPPSTWPVGMTVDTLIAQMNAALQLPGVSNAWTMPIKARIDMLSTGIRTPVGVKVFGPDLQELDKLAAQIVRVVHGVKGTTSAFAERTEGGHYISITPNREAAARYGLSVDDIQKVVAVALGGETVTTTVEGRERYSVNVRYPRGLRNDPQAIASQVLVPTMGGAMVPLGQVASVRVTLGPPSIRTENAQQVAYIYVDLEGRDLGGYVAEAARMVSAQVEMPPGYHIEWSGQFEYLQRAAAKLKIVVPATLALIFVLLFLNFALVGGTWLMWSLDYNISVAVAVGFIALTGVAAETGVVMLIYLDNALAEIRTQRQAEGAELSRSDLRRAIMTGAVERVRPKMMTVVAIMAGLLPILWSTGTGSEVMRRIAVPMVGGMVSSTVLTLLVIPAIYTIVKGWRLPQENAAPAAVREHAASPAE